jgi:hypothetical protein
MGMVGSQVQGFSNSVIVPMAASDIEDIPSTPGIYAYYIAFLSRRSLGLFHGGDISEQDIFSAKLILARKFKQFLALRKERRYEGSVRDAQRYSHIAPSYSIRLEEDFVAAPVDALLAMSDSSFLNAVDILESTLLLQSPVYVGIAIEQTLQDRCLQHRSDFYNGSNSSAFGSRLKKFGFEWADLVFVASPSRAYGNELREVEKAVQLLINPILGLR